MADQDMINDIDNENLLDDDKNLPEPEQDIADDEAPVGTLEHTEEDRVKVEDLPLDKRVQLAKNCPNPYGQVKVGLWVDALDSINAWLSAYIEEIDDNMIRVHFDGWPNKWDEWMKINSYKVSPFRKNSMGYTGQTKVAIRKNEPTIEEYKSMILKMDDCIKNNMKGLGALDTTQFFRGDIFCGLDNLMGRTYEANETELFEFSIEFIKKTIELVVTYIKLVPSMLGRFKEYKVEQDLFLVDENVAIA